MRSTSKGESACVVRGVSRKKYQSKSATPRTKTSTCPLAMSDSGDDIDSRTAAVGAPRSRSNAPSLHSDTSSRPTKRQRRTASRDNRDVKDFVPRGAAFTAQSLEVDPDETSSSGSSSNSSDDDAPEPTAANPNAGSTAPVISWNQGKRNAVRTTLGRPKANGAGANGAATKQFNSVNDKYWRPRSSSVSSGEGHRARQATNSDMNEDTSDEDDDEEDSQSDSDDSESLDSEEDDSIMLNIGTKPQGTPDNHSPESAVANGGRVNGQVDGSAYQTSPATSKEQAFQAFSRKYPTAPVILLDLTPSDMQTQLVFFYWDRPGIKLDLQSPPGCIECLQQGHLADLCPTKEVSVILPPPNPIRYPNPSPVCTLWKMGLTPKLILSLVAKMSTMSRTWPRRRCMPIGPEELCIRSPM